VTKTHLNTPKKNTCIIPDDINPLHWLSCNQCKSKRDQRLREESHLVIRGVKSAVKNRGERFKKIGVRIQKPI